MISFSRFFGSHFFSHIHFYPLSRLSFLIHDFIGGRMSMMMRRRKLKSTPPPPRRSQEKKIKQQQSNKHACTLFWLWLRLANTLLHTNYFHTTPESHINISRKEFSTTNHRHHQEQNRITHYYSLISPFLIWCTCATSSTQLFAVKQQ